MGKKIPSWLRYKWRHHRMALVLGLSVSLHLLVWGGIVWARLLDPAPIPPKPKAKKKISLTFIKPKPKTLVEVPKELESKTQPKKAEHYSERPAQAANPKPSPKPQAKPEIPGQQSHIPTLVNAPPAPPKLSAANAIQPQANTPKPAPPKTTPPRPPTPKTGLNISIKPKPPEIKTPSPEPRHRPDHNTAKANTLPIPDLDLPRINPSQASALTPAQQAALDRLKKAQASAGSLPGPFPFKQPGGIARNRPASLDVEGMFEDAEYDKRMLTAIYLRWIDLNRRREVSESYRVVILFNQTSKGDIKDLRVVSVNADRSAKATANSMPGFLCGHSIQGLSPFGDWPASLRQRIGPRFRRCRFTFTYTIIRR